MEVDEENNASKISDQNDKEDSENIQNKNEEELECDFSAYILFHEGSTGAPCLSFDIVEDNLGTNRTCENPLICYFITGSQAQSGHDDNIVLMKMANLHKVSQKNDEDLSDDENEDELPVISSAMVPHKGCVNRIRTTKLNSKNLAATWSESGKVHIWDINPMIQTVENIEKETSGEGLTNSFPLFTSSNHESEGFALDWSKKSPGTLASGDCAKNIFISVPNDSGGWTMNSKSLFGHFDSVEDIQWSPSEANILASCSVDKSIRIWDIRADPTRANMITCENAHSSDVNVINWNLNDPFIVSGGDDGYALVWDLRKFQSHKPVARLKHEGAVCSLEWHPDDSSVFASASEDDTVLQWDLAVEADKDTQVSGVPDQLLFVHKGQKEIKEIHWHPQIPGLLISTALSGFNIFKTISC